MEFMQGLEQFMGGILRDELEKRPPRPTEHLRYSVKTCKPKHIFRIAEKAAFRVGKPGDCSAVTDVVRSRVACGSCRGFLNVLDFLEKRRDDVQVVQVDERFTTPQVGSGPTAASM